MATEAEKKMMKEIETLKSQIERSKIATETEKKMSQEIKDLKTLIERGKTEPKFYRKHENVRTYDGTEDVVEWVRDCEGIIPIMPIFIRMIMMS